jgi:carbon-monoxide dehydrogenase large subunit
LFEEVVYASDGQNLSATLLDYAMPIASDLPSFDVQHVEHPDPATPLGMKGMAEGGVMGASAAISNAIADALAPFDAVAGRQPFTASRLSEALGAAAGRGDRAGRRPGS